MSDDNKLVNFLVSLSSGVVLGIRAHGFDQTDAGVVFLRGDEQVGFVSHDAMEAVVRESWASVVVPSGK